MRCEDAQLAVSTRADGERIDAPTPAALDGHLDTCASCRDFATAVRTVRSTLRLEPVDPGAPAKPVTNAAAASPTADGSPASASSDLPLRSMGSLSTLAA